MKTRDMILNELGSGPKSFEYLFEQLGLSYDSLRGAINRLLKAKLIISPAKNEYSYSTPAGVKIYTNTSIKLSPVVPPPKPKLNRVILILDDSGSMAHIRESTKKAFNKVLEDIKANAKKYDQETKVSIYKFGTRVSCEEYQVNASDIRPIDYYYPDQGGTMLFDAVARGINDHHSYDFVANRGKDISYLLVVLTDGDNNRTDVYDSVALGRLMDTVLKTDRWTITFQLPPRTKSRFLSMFPSIPAGNVMEWEQSNEGVAFAAAAAGAGFNSYYAARSTGATKSTEFFTVNANDITRRDLNKLNNIQSLTKSWNVERETDITSFSHEKLGFYTAGTLYYQLTKTEELQSYKKILVQKRFSKEIYAGLEARNLLGLPAHGTCKVRPGNLGDYDVFIQSTSVNRKLVRGTRVVYYPGN